MNSTQDTMAFLRNQYESGTSAWKGLCLKLQRTARGLPGVYPSALSAQHATPEDHRYSLESATRGMIAYFDDPHDSNPYGHIVAVAGRDKDGEVLCWTNDAAGPGKVSLVRASFFRQYWGDTFQFATDWLNGYVLDLPERKVTPKNPPLSEGAPRIENAIKELTRAIAHHKRENHPVLVKALERDRAYLQSTLKKFGG